MRLLVTRPQPQADEWVARLRALGADAVALPLLTIEGAPDAQALHAAWEGLSRQSLVMFVSPSAVARFFEARPAGWPWPVSALAGSTGPGTSQALAACGVPQACLVEPDRSAGRFDSEALWARIADRLWQDRDVLIVRGEGGRDWLADTLRAAGARVGFVEAYRRAAPALDPAQRACLAQALQAPTAHCWLFSSSQAVGQLPALCPGADWSRAQALATHPRIAEAARALGFLAVRVVAPNPQAIGDALAGRR